MVEDIKDKIVEIIESKIHEGYTGPERRHILQEGKEGRRDNDWKCGEHTLLWKHHDEERQNFREIVSKDQGLACGKIKKLEEFHIRDVGEVKQALEKKADKNELKPVTRTIGILITLGCLVVGSIMSGSLIWIKADMATAKTERIEAINHAQAAIVSTNKVLTDGFANLHRRITENEYKREDGFEKIDKRLDGIERVTDNTAYRVKQIEEKMPKK